MTSVESKIETFEELSYTVDPIKFHMKTFINIWWVINKHYSIIYQPKKNSSNKLVVHLKPYSQS